ncbi:hypothetical protein KRMM14A1259_57280 [Krasilnikovia sp. MM14-A1259]
MIAALTIPVGAATQMVVFPLWQGLRGESSADAWAQATVWVGAIAGAVLVVVRYGRLLLARGHPARYSELSSDLVTQGRAAGAEHDPAPVGVAPTTTPG